MPSTKSFLLTSLFAASLFTFSTAFTVRKTTTLVQNNSFILHAKPKVQVALLLDVSGSMDGLLEQAKAQIWKMVNQLATTKKNGESPDIEIALYVLGKAGVAKELEQLMPFSTDLDKISETLFALKTSGSDERCGEVIEDAIDKLVWDKSNEALKMIIIAGNESFQQGSTKYEDACKKAITNGVYVNTIFCGRCDEGVQLKWKDAADRAEGKYLCIDQNATVQHVVTPFDDKIGKLNDELNSTYVAFGNAGRQRREMQAVQDKNSEKVSKANKTERSLSKASKNYKNESWDLVDNYATNGSAAISKDKEAELPEEMKKMSEAEREQYIKDKKAAREKIQAEIKDLGTQRQKFIDEENKKNASNSTNTLDKAVFETINEQALKKNFEVQK